MMTHPTRDFFDLYRHDFVRVAVAVPEVRVANPDFHAQAIITQLQDAATQHAALVLFPELSLSAYTCDDLFHQRALLDGCLDALSDILEQTKELALTAVFGMPLQVDELLYNVGVVVSQGRILGVVPKTYLPNYREFYEARQFHSGDTALRTHIDLCGQRDIPFGSKLLFQLAEQPLCRFAIEICEDLWVPTPPSSMAALAGATMLLNLSASNIVVDKAGYRHQLAASQSARCLAAYLYSAAGTGESTTDLAWDGHAMIYENGDLLGETPRFSLDAQLLYADIDLERLSQERLRLTSFGQARQRHRNELRSYRTIQIDTPLPRSADALLLDRDYERFPYVPSDPSRRDQRCYEAYQIQVQGLVKRLRSAKIEKVVIGVSGGLDSTHALIVCARAMDYLGYPRSNILAYTMPAFATSQRTLDQALGLMEAIGCTAHQLDIRPSCEQMLKDLDHPYSRGEAVYDITFENVQAGERTNHLFRLANHLGAMVVGTGDLSELALGWCTYGVGDHMSHYNVNASVPKTLIQYLIRWVADTQELGADTAQVLYAILDTEISPELIPSDPGDEQPAQRTEDTIGPYELQDFHLYYILRFGYKPAKIAFLAYNAWHDVTRGSWPDVPEARRNHYDLDAITQHLRTFLWRFFQTSQFKRSCVPNGPKVGSGGSLSPRGDYRAPSDSEAAVWLKELEAVTENRG